MCISEEKTKHNAELDSGFYLKTIFGFSLSVFLIKKKTERISFVRIKNVNICYT